MPLLPTTTSAPLTTDFITTSSMATILPKESFTASPTIMDMWMSQLQKDHPEISFVIPSQHDNQHIDNMMQFKQLLEKVGNTAYDTITAGSQHYENHKHNNNVLIDSMGQTITHEQISNSAVLNLADLKNNALTGLERFFSGTDMHSLINYLWVGVVTSLIVLTVIFVLFSCYFYRKFREWKKCNKDIRAHFNNDMYPGGLMPCDVGVNPEAAYYQVESPPCYTIATGLPTYDEALHHNQQHFAFGMKFIYPTLAAVHHQASNLISSWEKYDITSRDKKTVDACPISDCKPKQIHNSKRIQVAASNPPTSVTLEASTATSAASALLLPPPPSYEVAASSALLNEQVCANVAITMPQLDLCASAKSSSDLTDIITV